MRIMICFLSLLASAIPAHAHTSVSSRDPYARLIDRADAVVLGRVVDAGVHELPAPGSNRRAVVAQNFIRIAVDRWIVGPDTDAVINVRLGEASPSALLQGRTTESDTRVIGYLIRSRNEWWMLLDHAGDQQHPAVGVEVLPLHQANDRISAILDEAKASAPTNLAAQADIVVVGSLNRFVPTPPGVICHIDTVVAGGVSSSEITVVTRSPRDLRLGKALLLLKERSDSTWELLNDGASCYYLDADRLAHTNAPLDNVLARVASAHAHRDGGAKR